MQLCCEIRGSENDTAEGSSRPEMTDPEEEALRSFETSVNCSPQDAGF